MNIGDNVMPKINRIVVKTIQTHLDQLSVMEINTELEVSPGKLFPVSCTTGDSP